MISVVIPAYNEEKVICACLEALVNQTYVNDCEIILVDNNSTDQTVENAQKYTDKIRLLIIREKIKGRGAARLAGFKKAHGEIIFSTDADTVVPPNWIEKILPEFRHDRIVAVTGTCRFTDSDAVTNSVLNICLPYTMRLYRILFGHYWLSGFNFAITKKAYQNSGGFNPKLNGQEDTELAFRVSKIGRIKFVAQPAVIASGRRFKNGFMHGVYPYLATYIRYFFFNNADIEFSDER